MGRCEGTCLRWVGGLIAVHSIYRLHSLRLLEFNIAEDLRQSRETAEGDTSKFKTGVDVGESPMLTIHSKSVPTKPQNPDLNRM